MIYLNLFLSRSLSLSLWHQCCRCVHATHARTHERTHAKCKWYSMLLDIMQTRAKAGGAEWHIINSLVHDLSTSRLEHVCLPACVCVCVYSVLMCTRTYIQTTLKCGVSKSRNSGGHFNIMLLHVCVCVCGREMGESLGMHYMDITPPPPLLHPMPQLRYNINMEIPLGTYSIAMDDWTSYNIHSGSAVLSLLHMEFTNWIKGRERKKTCAQLLVE